MEGANMGQFVDVSDEAYQLLHDAVASTSYDYDMALIEYQAALGSGDAGRQAEAESRLREALRRMSEAQTALAEARAPHRAQRQTFDDLLYDPMQQLDAAGEVMASVLAYGAAVQTTSSASSAWSTTQAPREYRAAMYVQERLIASSAVATAVATASAS